MDSVKSFGMSVDMVVIASDFWAADGSDGPANANQAILAYPARSSKNSDAGFTAVTSNRSRALVHATYSKCRSVL